jgi:hypothetical protein
MALDIEGYVEVEAELFNPGVLEEGFSRFLSEEPLVTFAADRAEPLGKVTRISGRGDRVLISATLTPPPQGTRAADAYRKIASGTIKGLAIDGVFAANRAVVSSVAVRPLTPVLGTGFITSVEGAP